jgi:hydroxymethylbilane synthase
MPTITIATRGSKLALWQAEHIAARLRERHPGLAVELLKIKTTGDKILDVPLAKVGGKGLFVKEIEEALLDGRADIAVHSMKDVPAVLPAGLVIGAVPQREDPTDALLSVAYDGLAGLPRGARVGTSSLRRQAQLAALRPDLAIETLRGNLDTRVKKLLSGQFAAIVVASAGLNRLGLAAPKRHTLAPPEFLPAVAQGALGIELRADRADVASLLAFLDHEPTRLAVTAERAFLAGLEGGCQVPIAAWSVLENGRLILTGFVADTRGSRAVRLAESGSASEAERIGRVLAERVKDAGGREILAEVYAQGS